MTQHGGDLKECQMREAGARYEREREMDSHEKKSPHVIPRTLPYMKNGDKTTGLNEKRQNGKQS